MGGGEVKFSLVDTKTRQVLATWVEIVEDEGWGEDCYNYDEVENTSKPGEVVGKFDPYSVFIGKLDPRTTEEELRRHFFIAGEIRRVTQLRSKKTGMPTGSAFLQFSDLGAAGRALFLDRSYLRGKLISVTEKLFLDGGDYKDDQNIDPSSVYVGNLDHSVTSLDLASYFHEVGEISKVTVLKNKETGQHKGAAYVQFKDQGGLERALSLDGSFIAGKNVKIRRKRKTISAEDSNNNKKIKKDLSDDEEASTAHDPYSVYVGNVDVRANNYDLAEHFQSTGEVVRVTIMKNRNNKAAAYIQFKDHWSVEGALCMDGTKLRDRELKVRRKKMKGE